MAKLVAQSGPTAGREYPLVKDVTALGRQSSQDIQIVDNMASRAHCQVRRDGRFWSLVDLGSRNGTQLNGRKVNERLLAFGDRIRVGEVEFQLVKEPGDVELADLLTKYELKEKLGEGGMGIVYKAVQKSMAREVALKILAPRHASKQRFVDQFIAEARAAGKLNHHNLIQVHDVSTENDLHYFSMEYVDGPTAMEMLRRQGPFEAAEAVEIIRQVSRALAYAHDHRLIHQDIKPDNIMVGAGNVVKLADLGISKTFDEAETEGDDKKIMGTPAYMAPEAALGKRVDHRIDIYALGATLFHLLTGRTPFHGATPTEVLKAHVHQEVPSLRDINPQVPTGLDLLVRRMMAKNPDDRPQTALEVEQALDQLVLPQAEGAASASETNILRRYAAGSGSPGTRDDTPENVPVPVASARRFPVGMVVGIALLVGLGAGAAVALSRKEPEPAAPAAPQPAPVAATTPAAAPVAPAPRPEAGRPQLATLVDELEVAVSKPADQIDLKALRARFQALPKDLPKELAERRLGIEDRLQALESQAVNNRILDQFARLRQETETLVKQKNFDLAISRLNAFKAKDNPQVAERFREALEEAEREKQAFLNDLDDHTQTLIVRKDLNGLRDLRNGLPQAFLGSPQENRLAQAIKTLEDERTAATNAQVAAAAKDFRDWNFGAVADRLANQKALLAGTPSEAALQTWIAAGRVLEGLPGAIATRMRTLRQFRYRGVLGGFVDPDIMGADREQGLELKEANGGAVFLRWGKIPAKDLQNVADLLLKQDAETYRAAIATLGQAAQVK